MRKCIFFAALFFNSLLAVAQKPLPANMFTKKLDNGLTVLVVEDNSVPLATISMGVKNGAYTESPEFNGLSHLYEHMFFKADKDYADQHAFLQQTQELGIIFNGTTNEEKVEYFFTLPNYNLMAGLKLMNSAIRYPAFDNDEIKKERKVVDAEFQRKESNPYYKLIDSMNHHLWGQLYSRKNPIGNHDIINAATPEQMIAIQKKYYWPNNSILIIAGDVHHEEAFNIVENLFKDWAPSGFDPFEKFPVPEMKPIEKDDYFIVDSKNTKATMLLFEWQGPDTRRDVLNTYVADIFSFLLAQNSSKLHQALIGSGLASSVSVNYYTQKYTGPISFYIVPNPSKEKECVEVFKQQLALFDSDNYFTDEQLAIAKRFYEIRQEREQESTSEFTHTLSFWWCSASLDYFNTYIDNLNKVTHQDIKNYVQKYLKGAHYCAGMLLNTDNRNEINPESFFKAN